MSMPPVFKKIVSNYVDMESLLKKISEAEVGWGAVSEEEAKEMGEAVIKFKALLDEIQPMVENAVNDSFIELGLDMPKGGIKLDIAYHKQRDVVAFFDPLTGNVFFNVDSYWFEHRIVPFIHNEPTVIMYILDVLAHEVAHKVHGAFGEELHVHGVTFREIEAKVTEKLLEAFGKSLMEIYAPRTVTKDVADSLKRLVSNIPLETVGFTEILPREIVSESVTDNEYRKAIKELLKHGLGSGFVELIPLTNDMFFIHFYFLFPKVKIIEPSTGFSARVGVSVIRKLRLDGVASGVKGVSDWVLYLTKPSGLNLEKEEFPFAGCTSQNVSGTLLRGLVRDIEAILSNVIMPESWLSIGVSLSVKIGPARGFSEVSIPLVVWLKKRATDFRTEIQVNIDSLALLTGRGGSHMIYGSSKLGSSAKVYIESLSMILKNYVPENVREKIISNVMSGNPLVSRDILPKHGLTGESLKKPSMFRFTLVKNVEVSKADDILEGIARIGPGETCRYLYILQPHFKRPLV